MGRKRSRSRKTKRSSLFSRLVKIIWVVVGLGGITLWAGSDLPVLGPLIQCVVPGGPDATNTESPSEPSQSDPVTDSLQRAARPLRRSPSPNSSTGESTPQARSSTRTDTAPATIKIASFNIQVFGESKLSEPWVVEVLTRIVRRFDVVAIQGIRCTEDHIIPEFVRGVNADGRAYNYVVSPRLGRTTGKEQYAFVYDTAHIEIDMTSAGTMQDPQDQLHREPFVTRFRARTPNPSKAFSFWLVNVHTDPDEVDQEVDTLADAFIVMQQARDNEDDVILLGNLNANPQQFGLLGHVPGITWVVRGTITNTRRQKMHDNILFDGARTAEYTGRWGVYEFQTIYQLSRAQALDVSDHLPVWAEFSSHESAAGNAALLPSDQMTR